MTPKTDAQKQAVKRIFRVEKGAIVLDPLSVPKEGRMSGYLATKRAFATM